MKPVTLKNNTLIPVERLLHWFLIFTAILVFYAAWFIDLSFGFFGLMLLGLIFLNRKKIHKCPNISLVMTAEMQWHVVINQRAISCDLVSYWSWPMCLFLVLKNEVNTHHFLVTRGRITGAEFSRLILGVQHNAPQSDQ